MQGCKGAGVPGAGCRVLGAGARALALLLSLTAVVAAQSDAKSQSDRVAARIRALQAESDRLAAQARTVSRARVAYRCAKAKSSRGHACCDC